MNRTLSKALPPAVYLLVAACLTWPVSLELGQMLPGAERSDLWNSLWSLWFFQHQMLAGVSPSSTELLGFPHGGNIAVADPLNALLGLALVPMLGVARTYGLLVVGHLAFAGWAAHRLAEELAPSEPRHAGPWLAGLAYMMAPVLISAVHNGTSEAIAAGWLPLSLWAGLNALRRGGARSAILASLALGAALWSSWYLGLCAVMGLGCLLAAGEGSEKGRVRLVRLLPVLTCGVALALPLAIWQLSASTGAGNLVGIKDVAELALVRRMTGAADPLGFFAPFGFRSPDFRQLSRYGEDFIHCAYLGWLLIGAAAVGLGRRSRRSTWIALAGLLGLVLAMGPVLVRGGQPLILPGDRAIPLPYLLLEELPGFSGLSLLFRLALLPSLALALLASFAITGLRSRAWSLGLALTLGVIVELRWVAPVHGLPDRTAVPESSALEILASAPDGAVMNFPVVGGRRYLYEQTIHGKPITGGLNFPNNAASMRVWDVIIEDGASSADGYRARVERAACEEGIGYLAVHVDPMARPDRHDRGVRALHHTLPVLAEQSDLRIHILCPELPR
jgi:hypothetical protein